MSRALVLEEKGKLSIREIDVPDRLGPADVRIEIDTVGICGSDVHYFTHGRIGPFVVEAPMVLGHEAAGTVVDVGADVKDLKPGDRVCMEPGIPDMTSRASKLGKYNVDPAVTFWATPPVHGCLTSRVVHPAAFTYRLPDNVSFAEGAMVEPFAIGLQAAAQARIRPGDIAYVIGAGPIGIMTALAALAGGCARVFISDLSETKLKIAERYDNVIGIRAGSENPAEVIAEATGAWGVDILFECSGAPAVFRDLFRPVRPGGCVVFVGMPVEPVQIDIVTAQAKELRMETVFRYANVFDRALDIMASGRVDLKPLITGTYSFEDAIAAFERAVAQNPEDVKLQITMG